MWFTSLLAWLKRSAGRQPTKRLAEGRRRQRRPNALRARPRLEALEDRTLLSIAWTAAMPGEWSVADNWTDDMQRHRVPGPNDDVSLPRLQGAYTVSAPSACKSLSLQDLSALGQ